MIFFSIFWSTAALINTQYKLKSKHLNTCFATVSYKVRVPEQPMMRSVVQLQF